MEHHYLALGNFSSEEIGKVEKAWGRWNPENYPGFQSLDSGSLLLPALAQIHIHKYTNTSSSMFGVDGRRVILKVILSLVEGSHLLTPSVCLFDIGVVCFYNMTGIRPIIINDHQSSSIIINDLQSSSMIINHHQSSSMIMPPS